MPDASVKGKLHTGFGQWPPSPAVEGSPNVTIGGAPALREGDRFADGSVVEKGAPHVFINGKPAARMDEA
jgi:uncharacterized Zn-binding protein involved in type VI secretion